MTIQRWLEVDGDNTLALDWPLNENSHVWEIGGFEGRWAQQIWDKYHCHITIFEPQGWAVSRMKKRFEGTDKIKIHPYGLWTEDTELLIGNYHTDGASVMRDDGREPKVLGVFKDYKKVFAKNNYHLIDLVLMNIEGAEYTLIPEFIVSGNMETIKNFFCQFHPFREGDLERQEKTLESLIPSHNLLWNYFPTAVAWTMKPEFLKLFEEKQ